MWVRIYCVVVVQAVVQFGELKRSADLNCHNQHGFRAAYFFTLIRNLPNAAHVWGFTRKLFIPNAHPTALELDEGLSCSMRNNTFFTSGHVQYQSVLLSHFKT